MGISPLTRTNSLGIMQGLTGASVVSTVDHTRPSDKPDIAAQRKEELDKTAQRWLKDWHQLSVADFKRLAVQNLSKLYTNGDGSYSKREINLATQKTIESAEDAQFIYLMSCNFDDICKIKSGSDVFYYPNISASDMDKFAGNTPVQRFAATDKDIPTFSKLLSAETRDLPNRIKWLPLELYASAGSPLESIKAQSVKQHTVGNCGWQASVASLAARNPMAIKHMIAERSDGSYTVHFPGSSKTKDIHVTPPPAIEQLISSWASPGGKWVGVLETALAKEFVGKPRRNTDQVLFNGTDLLQAATEGIHPRSALKKLTGNEVDWTTMSWSTTAQRLPEIMQLAETQHLPQVATIYQADSREAPKKHVKGLVAKHAYAIIGFDPVAEKVTIYEPNGRTEPLNEKDEALDGKLDGVFQMDLQEFALCFSDLFTSADKQTIKTIR